MPGTDWWMCVGCVFQIQSRFAGSTLKYKSLSLFSSWEYTSRLLYRTEKKLSSPLLVFLKTEQESIFLFIMFFFLLAELHLSNDSNWMTSVVCFFLLSPSLFPRRVCRRENRACCFGTWHTLLGKALVFFSWLLLSDRLTTLEHTFALKTRAGEKPCLRGRVSSATAAPSFKRPQTNILHINAQTFTRRTLSQYWNFKISRTTFLNYMKPADLLILRLWNCESVVGYYMVAAADHILYLSVYCVLANARPTLSPVFRNPKPVDRRFRAS